MDGDEGAFSPDGCHDEKHTLGDAWDTRGAEMTPNGFLLSKARAVLTCLQHLPPGV